MSRRKRKSTAKFKSNHPREIGKFYHVDDSNGGHPCMVYYCDPDNNLYYIQRFTQKYRDDRVQLTHNIDPHSNEKQWVNKTPEAVGYDNMKYLDKYKEYRIHEDDIETVKSLQKYDLKK